MTRPKTTKRPKLPQEILDAIGRYVNARNRSKINANRMNAEAATIDGWFADVVAPLPPDMWTTTNEVELNAHATATVQSTWVQKTTTVLDEGALKERVGARVFNAVTRVVREVDQDRLAVAIKDGKITPEDIAACTTVTPGKGYVLHTVQGGA